MRSLNVPKALTMLEARQRAALVRVEAYEVGVDLTGGPDTFRTTTTIRFTATAPGAATFAEVRPAVPHARLNGAALDPGSLAEGRLPLPALRARNELVVEADYAYSHASEGMHRFVDPADGEVYVYAQPSIAQARDDLHPIVCRSVVDATDDLRRALAARARGA